MQVLIWIRHCLISLLCPLLEKAVSTILNHEIMMELFYMGGPLFMGILTFIFIAMIVIAVINGIPFLKGKYSDLDEGRRKLAYIKDAGLLALVIGVLGQLIGLFSAFKAIEMSMMDISPAMLAGGVKVSMITTIYGLVIYALSLLIWVGLRR
ncbi:MAG: hypothetical protein EP346_03060 [Bacteroidetes bacterium]|nr:MAG: hypothetical protein EP346_03060 [Bacteroidota bacterium]